MNELFELNYSKINSYMFCPHLYEYVYVKKKYVPHNPYSSLGISLHRTLKKYALGKLDLESLFIAYEESWENSGYSSPKEMMEFYNKGNKMLESFWLNEQSMDNQIIFAEKDFEFKLEDFIIRGTIDRVDKRKDGSYELIEYKTGGDDEKYAGNINNNLQLLIYALGLKESFSIEIFYLSVYMISSGHKMTEKFDISKNMETTAFLKDMGDKIKNLKFERKGNCSICQIKNLCEFKN